MPRGALSGSRIYRRKTSDGRDLVNAIDGVTFEEAWPGRFDAVIQPEKGDVPIAFIGLDALVKNKRASGRPKDLDDLDYLTRDR